MWWRIGVSEKQRREENIMEIKAYACKHCESIYKTAQKASACEKKCVARIAEEKTEEERQANLQTLVNYVRLNAESIEDICRMSEEVSLKLFPKSSIKKMKLRVSYAPHASNSHSAPLGEFENWGRKEGKPTGYPALRGSITVVYNKEPKGFSSSTFNSRDGICGIHTGDGGYRSGDGGYTVGYDVTLWLSDFPKIKAAIEAKQKEIDSYEIFRSKLSGEYIDQVSADAEINAAKSNIEDFEDEIRKLRELIACEQGIIKDKKENYSTPKQEILDKEYEKTSNDFGLSRGQQSLTSIW